MINNEEAVEVIPFYYSATTVSRLSGTPYSGNPIYKGVLESEPDVVVILLGLNDAKRGNFEKIVFETDYKKMIKDL